MTGTEIDDAVVARLQGDMGPGGLGELAPGGVWPDVAPEGVADPFIVVGLQAHEDIDQLEGVAYEQPLYLVKAVGRSSNAAAARAAYARVHALLQDAALTISGHHCMDVRRQSRIAYTELDGPVYWKHVGGLYAVEAHAS